MALMRPPPLAVAVHDIDPCTFQRVKQIRIWLQEHGVERVTLLVIPASHQRPIGIHAPLALWLRGRVAAGDTVAQHGFSHRIAGSSGWARRVRPDWHGGAAAEFPGLGGEQAARRVACGRRVLGDIDLDPRGFVAPGYAYTAALRNLLGESFDWFADVHGIRTRRGREIRARALSLGSGRAIDRASAGQGAEPGSRRGRARRRPSGRLRPSGTRAGARMAAGPRGSPLRGHLRRAHRLSRPPQRLRRAGAFRSHASASSSSSSSRLALRRSTRTAASRRPHQTSAHASRSAWTAVMTPGSSTITFM